MSIKIYARALWDAIKPKRKYYLPGYPVDVVFIHHGAGFTTLNLADADGDGIPDKEENIWRGYQRYHMKTRGWTDIAYNFGVGLSGSVLRGRGWKRQGGATGNPEDRYSLSICAIGNFDTQQPTDAMVQAIADWILTGIEKGHIQPTVVIKGHKDKPYATACPGRYLYAQLPKIRSLVAAGRIDLPMIGIPTDQNWIDDVKDTSDGHKSEAIRVWQLKLEEWGFFTAADIDGVKGPSTRKAHHRWETSQGFATPNGKPGKVSWPRLLAGPADETKTVEVKVIEYRTSLDVRALITELHDITG